VIQARRLVKSALSLSLLALTLLVLFTALTGRPFVSYATSGSMEPTIGTLDGFLVHPFPADLQVGDIIVFQSDLRGGPVVHRIVGGSPDGWETQGDANARPDQTQGEPPVSRDRILGKVVTRDDGSVVLLQGLGVTVLEARVKLVVAENAVGGPRQLQALAFLALAALAAVPAFAIGRRQRRLPARLPLRARVLLRRVFPRGILGRHVGYALLVLVCSSVAFSAAHAGHDVTTRLIVLQDRAAADEERATWPGNELRRDIPVRSLGLLPTLVVLDETERVRPEARTLPLAPLGEGIVTIHQRAGDKVGMQEDVARVYRYPALLPEGVVLALHDTAPGLPYVAMGAIAGAVGAAWFARLRVSTLPVGRMLRIPEEWL